MFHDKTQQVRHSSYLTASNIFLTKGWTLRGSLASLRISISSSLDRKKNLISSVTCRWLSGWVELS